MYQAHARELLNQKERKTEEDSAAGALDSATKRLNAALDRLEDGLRARGGLVSPISADEETAAENLSLRRERANLNAAIARLQDQYDDMHRSASTIYSKLEDAIKRLTRIVGK